MRKLTSRCALSTVLVFLLMTNISFAQENLKKISQLEIPNSSLHVDIDGDINEPIWDDALTLSLDIVNNPWDNLPSPVKTEAKIIENGEFIYIAFIAYDPNPNDIIGFLGDRDTRWSDDIVGIKLDTYNDRRLNYEFLVNPFGVQNDAIFNEMTGEVNDLWDGIWHSFGKITEQGFQVEIAIPYNILNFEESDDIKTWALELIRVYPRDSRLRLSHIPLDRDNACWLCQYPEAKGFKQAKAGNNLQITPAVVASSNQQRDIYDENDNWDNENDIDAGIDLRWGINPNNTLSLTVNPDFSTIEADAGQLSINKTFSLYYDEKRAFFLDNSDYFSSNYDLVYTRNIGDPDYGVKLTGKEGQHSYGVFVTNDTNTTFINPDNLYSNLTSLDKESHSSALRYRFDYSDSFSVGAISTLRTADDYHNNLLGIDAKYRFDESNSILVQTLTADSSVILMGESTDNSQTDQAYKIELVHDSEYWQINAEHQQIGEDFRADLGYMPKADFKQTNLSINRLFYGSDDSLWTESSLSGQWEILHNENNEFIERSLTTQFGIDGPKLSYFNMQLIHADKVGLRHDINNRSIDGNTTRFTENQIRLSGNIQPLNRLYGSLDVTFGDKISYLNDQLGDISEVSANLTWNVTNHFQADIYQTYSQLDLNDGIAYIENITDIRLSYQFDVNSYVKLTFVYIDVDYNPDNTPENGESYRIKNLATQLIYAYKLNPQTVFFLGYSDNSFQDNTLNKLEREQRTFFSKISYAWLP